MNRATILEEIRRNVDLLSVTDQPEYQYIPLHQKPSPSVTALREIMTLLRKVIFPGFFGTEQEAQTDSIQYYTGDRKSTRLNSSHMPKTRMPSSA